MHNIMCNMRKMIYNIGKNILKTGGRKQVCWKKLDLTRKMDKEEYRAKMDRLEASLGKLQRRCKELGYPGDDRL